MNAERACGRPKGKEIPDSPETKRSKKRGREVNYKERRKELNQNIKRLRVHERTQELWRGLRQTAGISSDDRFAEVLLRTYQEHTNQCVHNQTAGPSLRMGRDRKGVKGWLLTSSSAIGKTSTGGEGDSSSDEASLRSSASSFTPWVEGEPAETFSEGIDCSVGLTENESFIYPGVHIKQEVEDNSDSDFEPPTGMETGLLWENLSRIRGGDGHVVGGAPCPGDDWEEGQEEAGSTSTTTSPATSSTTSKSGLHHEITSQEAAEVDFFLVSRSRLLDLAEMTRSTCQRCPSKLTASVKPAMGTAAHVVWTCPEGHRSSWCSQETLDKSHIGDVNLARAILLSGNTFSQVQLLARFLPLNLMDQSSFYTLQQKFVTPVLEDRWKKMHEAKHIATPIVVCGDVHSTQYLTYALMEPSSVL